MFWRKKDSSNKGPKPKSKTGSQATEAEDTKECGVNRGSQRRSSDQIREEALANARAARERLGEETIQKIAEALNKKRNSPTEKAKSQIASADADRVAAEILAMMGEKD